MKKEELKSKIYECLKYYYDEIEDPKDFVVLDTLKEVRSEILTELFGPDIEQPFLGHLKDDKS